MKYFVAALLFLFLLPAAGFAQSGAALISASDSVYASDPDAAFALSRQAEMKAYETGDSLLLAKALARNARFLVLKSRFEESNTAVNKAIRLAEKNGDVKEQAYAIKLKAILMKRIGNLEEAISLEQQAANLYGKAGDTNGRVNVLLNLSLDYLDAADFTNAKLTLDTIGLYLPKVDTVMCYYYHQNRGSLLVAQGKYRNALSEYAQARPIAVKRKMTDSYVTLLTLIAGAQMNAGDLDSAMISVNESIRLARENRLDNELNEALTLLTDLYVREDNYPKAFATLKEQSELNSKIYNLERIGRINELEKQLQLSEKEKVIAAEKNKQEKLQAQNLLLYLIIFAVIAVAALSILLLLRTRRLNHRIAGQKQLIEEKSAIIEDAYKNITDSISYSKRIQNAILADDAFVKSLFPQSFILYKPKDIVSGDFYWFERWGNEILFAAIDCTGHGVPGAFMSIVAYNQLNEAVNIHGLSKPNLILNALTKGVSKALKQSGNSDEAGSYETQVRDGMDIALCAYEPATRRLSFAGAYNPLWIVRNGSIIEVAPDKQPIGAFPGQEIKPFTLKEMQLEAGDQLYLFSDGYADQFGGPRGKKFKYAQLKEVLLKITEEPMEKQLQVLDETIESWRGNFEQIDDILVMGIRVA